MHPPSLSVWKRLWSLATQKAPSDQTGRCPGWSESSLGVQLNCAFCRAPAHISWNTSWNNSDPIYFMKSLLEILQNYELGHDKTNKVSVRPAKTQISLGIRPIWSASSLSAWRNLGSLATHWVYSKDSDQTGLMPRLIWVFAGRTLILLVLSTCGSYCCDIRWNCSKSWHTLIFYHYTAFQVVRNFWYV